MAFNSNNDDYSIIQEGELSTILARFDNDMVFDIVQSNLQDKYRDYSSNLSNLVYSLEDNFKQTKAIYGDQMEITEKRNEIYVQIINQICNFYDIRYNSQMEDSTNIYSAAFYLYSFFISDFSKNVISFFVNYIIREQESLYNLLNLDENKKIKDTSSSYSKKIYEDNPKLAAIHGDLATVINNICSFDIDIYSYINTIFFDNKQVAAYLSSLIVEDGSNVFKLSVAPYIRNYLPIIITDVRLALQEIIQN